MNCNTNHNINNNSRKRKRHDANMNNNNTNNNNNNNNNNYKRSGSLKLKNMAEMKSALSHAQNNDAQELVFNRLQTMKGSDFVYSMHMVMVVDTPSNKKHILLALGREEDTSLYSASLRRHHPSQFQLRSRFVPCSFHLEFHPDGRSLLACNGLNDVLIWNVRDVSNPIKVRVLSHPDGVICAHWVRGDMIITACCDGFIHIFNRNFVCNRFSTGVKGVKTMACTSNTIVVGNLVELFALTWKDASHVSSIGKLHTGSVGSITS